MKYTQTLLAMSLVFGLTCGGWTQDNKSPNDPLESTDAPQSSDIAAIRETASTFKKAFDAGDAQAVAAHWTTDGEYADESSRRIQGREAIAREYAAFFAAHPGVRITSHINRLRLVNAETAIEEGTARLEPAGAGAPATTRYTAVHVKQDGNWLMCLVQDTRVETPSNYAHLQDLDRMIGTWSAEHGGVEFQVTNRWIANKNFIEQVFASHQDGEVIASGRRIIGWDPSRQKITSWTFNSDGGHAVGLWSPHDNGWLVETAGVMIDGTPTTAVNILSGLDDSAIAWRSVNRKAGSVRVPDTNEVILKRK